jgi:predicted enzyme related to lactoylglutathione lyase
MTLRGTGKRLKDAGVEFIEDPTDYGTVWIVTLKDPEGNLVQLLQSSRAA